MRSTSMKHEEARETPRQEARYHSPAFLRKAARLAEGKRRGKRASARGASARGASMRTSRRRSRG